MQAKLPNLIIGGAAIGEGLWSQLVSWQAQYNKKAFNVYGPTECTVNSLCTQVGIGGDKPNIGRLMANMKGYVLDEQQQLCVAGAPGELAIGGVGLARGYLHRPELTAECFIDNPYSAVGRIYRSGDKVRWLDNGQMEYLGRSDNQVKVRGYRVELAEIEAVLRAEPQVKDALVVIKGHAEDPSRLVAYVTVAEGVVKGAVEGDDSVDLALNLSHKLPEYMIPSAWQILTAFPLNVNGKVDLQALPEPDASSQQQYVAPSTETEVALCEVWQQLLGVGQVGVTDNFFKLGGHSLLLIKLLVALKAKFSASINAKLVFDLSDVQSLAAHIDVTSDSGKSGEATDATEMESFEL